MPSLTIKLTPVRISLLSLIVLVGLFLALFLWEPVWLFHRSELKMANEVIVQVEAFRAHNGRLPDSLEEVGFNNPNQRVFYRKVTETEYIVWFGRYSLGESEIFNSATKRWQ